MRERRSWEDPLLFWRDGSGPKLGMCRSAEGVFFFLPHGGVEDPKRQSRSVRPANPVGIPWLAEGRDSFSWDPQQAAFELCIVGLLFLRITDCFKCPD
jgi:hypothetical protein